MSENEKPFVDKLESAGGHGFEAWSYQGHVFRQYLKKNYKERAMYEMLSSRNEVADFGQSGQQINIKSNNLSVDTN